jgi:hypothetical protein
MDSTAVQWKTGTLTKISDNKNALRTKSVAGVYQQNPTIGAPFSIYGKALSLNVGMRAVITSPVISVATIDENVVEFSTENSKYRLQEKTDDN